MHLWRAFGKVNLELRVLGRRPDGYHNIETVLQTIDLSDEIHVSEAPEFRFETSAGPPDGSNLVVRAVRLFEARTGVSVRLKLSLEKRIPGGAGLGGGSADAAVTLMGLERYYRTGLSGDALLEGMSELGSDVPFFSLGGRALALGRGEVLFPLDDADFGWFVLLWPGIAIRTAEAYSWLTQTTESTKILGFCAHFLPEYGLFRSPWPVSGGDRGLNDFEEPVFRRFPVLGEFREGLLARGARLAALSGSGSTLFGEFPTRDQAREAAAAAAVPGAECGAFVVRPIGRVEYLGRIFAGDSAEV
jgi:4-diphosphocytidyl-2-C-methyl-D-erythritol kinase